MVCIYSRDAQNLHTWYNPVGTKVSYDSLRVITPPTPSSFNFGTSFGNGTAPSRRYCRVYHQITQITTQEPNQTSINKLINKCSRRIKPVLDSQHSKTLYFNLRKLKILDTLLKFLQYRACSFIEV